MEVSVMVTWLMIVLVQLHGYRSCVDKERTGLSEIKAYLLPLRADFLDILPSWSDGIESDCCRWEAIKCDNGSRRVIELDLSILITYYTPNKYLNLSYLYPFEELQSLNLSGNQFDRLFDDVEGYRSMGRFRRLEALDLSDNRFNESILPFLSAASSLKSLILRKNSLKDTFPMKELNNFGNLQLLDLSENLFNGPLPSQELPDLHKLELLHLSGNDFSGSLESQGICALKNLRELDLSSNSFAGHLPPCFGSLTKLEYLDVSSNKLSGKLPSSISNLESLRYLSLHDNNFEGSFSLGLMANLSKLEVFALSSRSYQLQVVTDPHWQPEFQLKVVWLSRCNLEEIPSFLMDQKELRDIDLSNNRLSRAFPTWLLENNQNLEVLLLQNNSFSMLKLPRLVHKLQVLDISANCFCFQLSEDAGRIFPSIGHLNLSHNMFQGNLPPYSGEMKNISFLDLSHNNFSGSLEGSFVTSCRGLSILKLSHNKFTGQVFPKEFSNLTSLFVFIADNNVFTGKIGDGLLMLNGLAKADISNNSLTGSVPSWIGNLSSLSELSASNNYLEGTLPASLSNGSRLVYLDLSGNMISGSLPTRFGNGVEVTALYLQNNDLTGSIPDTLLEKVGILDLRHNKLSGSVPHFVNTQNISVLLLRGNHLTGPVPESLCELSNMMLLDLALNRLNGSIPSCLNKVSFGLGGDRKTLDYLLAFSYLASHPGLPTYVAYLEIEVAFAAKRRLESYTNGNIGYMFGMDLSSNELSGEIPKEIGDLQKMRALNLSHNFLSGLIPDSFSNMTDIESIDLSFNMLYGRIPPQVSKLDSLVFFNVSYNNLSGAIPQGIHFSTLDGSNFLGNPLLCGPPTNRSCHVNDIEEHDFHERSDGETTIDMEVFYWSLLGTYVLVLMGFLVFMCFDSPWRRAWFRFVDSVFYSVKSMWS